MIMLHKGYSQSWIGPIQDITMEQQRGYREFPAYGKEYIMLSMYGILFTEIVLGVALMVLLFAPNANAEMSSDPSSKANSELQ